MTRAIKVKYVSKSLPISDVVAGAIVPFKRRLDIVDADVLAAKKAADLADLNAGKALRSTDEYNERFVDLSQKYGTTDRSVQANIENIRKVELDNASADNTAKLALKTASEAKGEAKSAKALAGQALDVGKDALGKAAGALGTALDAFDRIANIFNLIATLGTAVRMEFIRNELLQQIGANSRDIDALEKQMADAFRRIADNSNSIEDLERELMGIANALVQLKNQNNAILQNTSALLGGQNSIQSNINQVKTKVDTSIGQNTEILRDTDRIIALTSEIPNKIIPKIRPEVCLALQSPCNPANGNNNQQGQECDLSGVENELAKISQKIGTFPFNCQTPQPQNGFYNSVSQALQSAVCGGGSVPKALRDLFEEKDKSEEILSELDGINKQVASLYSNQGSMTSLMILSVSMGLQNTCRLSWEPQTYIDASVTEIKGLNLTFVDENNTDKTLAQWIGTDLDNLDIIPADFAERDDDTWLESSVNIVGLSRINLAISHASEQILTTTELTLDRLAIWLNVARKEGLVADKAYPYIVPVLTVSRYGRYDNYINAVNTSTATGDYEETNITALTEADKHPRIISSALPTLEAEKKGITDARKELVDHAKGIKEDEEASDDDSLLDNEAPENLVSAKDFLSYD